MLRVGEVKFLSTPRCLISVPVNLGCTGVVWVGKVVLAREVGSGKVGLRSSVEFQKLMRFLIFGSNPYGP